MKCPNCGNLEVKTLEKKADGTVYECPACDEKFEYGVAKN